PVLEHLAEPLGPLPQRLDVPLAALRRLPAVRAEERPDVVQRLYLGVYEVDRRLGVLVEVHGSKVVGARYRSESRRMVNTVASRLNPMLRSVILAAARSPRVERLVATAPVSRDVVRRFVAGTATADALRATRELADAGLGVSLDYLGEDTLTPDQAEQTRDEYVHLLRELAAAELTPAAEVSVKLTALGLKFDEKLALRLARENYAAATE